jgi:hypothetical protein
MAANKCVVCNKPIANVRNQTGIFTCSPSCAGKLAYSRREANKLRKQFDNEDKNQVRDYLIKHYIEPMNVCEKPGRKCFRILDFWGGGLFADRVLQLAAVHNQNLVEITTIDQEKNLFPALRAYAIKKNHEFGVKNHERPVIPFCGSLAEYVQRNPVKNQDRLDFIWLDYCGTVKQAFEDLPLVRKLASEKTTIAITAFCTRDGMINQRGRKMILDKNMEDNFPLHKRVKVITYNGMGVFIYKVPGSIFKKLSYLFK